MRQLEQLELAARRRSRSSGRGERRSQARGHSVEFVDYRSYVPGDDLRHLDWNLYGRLDRMFVKLYEEERESPVQIFLDASESMTYGTPAKFEMARRLAAAVGYVGLCGFDRVTVRVFPDPPARADRPGAENESAIRAGLKGVRGKRSALDYLKRLSELTAGGAGDFNEALGRGAREVRQPGVAVILSDLLDPGGYAVGLDALVSRGFHVHLLQVWSDAEWHPSTFGDLRVIDSETGIEQEVTFGRYRLKAYRQVVDDFTRGVRDFCRSRGIRFLQVTSEQSIEQVLLTGLRRERMLA